MLNLDLFNAVDSRAATESLELRRTLHDPGLAKLVNSCFLVKKNDSTFRLGVDRA